MDEFPQEPQHTEGGDDLDVITLSEPHEMTRIPSPVGEIIPDWLLWAWARALGVVALAAITAVYTIRWKNSLPVLTAVCAGIPFLIGLEMLIRAAWKTLRLIASDED